MSRIGKSCISVILLVSLIVTTSMAQMKRERANTATSVQTFSTPALMAQSTTKQLPGGNLNVTIMHSFGIATRNTIQNFFGFDNVQNVRLGLDFGLTDKWSVGVGRSSQFNVVDLRTKLSLLEQQSDNSIPLSLTLKGDMGIITQENRQPFKDDISTLTSAIVSRKFNDVISLQLAPSYAYFTNVRQGNKNHLFSVGLGSEIKLSDRYSLITEYFPVIGTRNPGTKNAYMLGLNIDTGGHVFQLFFTSTQWHLEQYVLANNRDQFWAGDFRFGFNVNRIFGL